jgi:glycosyltransferase involved in cell wall biosynthesis
MNILLLTDGIYPFTIGGMQKHSHYLAKFLLHRGHRVCLVHCVTGKDPLPEDQAVRDSLKARESLEVITLRFPSLDKMPGHYIKESYLYSKMVFKAVEHRLTEFDFVYAKGFAAWHLMEAKKRGTPCPPIGVKFHGYEMFQPAPSLREWLGMQMLKGPVKWNTRAADVVFSYGGKITDLIRKLGVPSEKIAEIPTGIEESWLRKESNEREDGTCRFLFIGRYERRKGIEELNRAIQMLPGNASWHFDFVGPIPPTKQIRSARVTYHGKVMDRDKMISLIDACDVLVAPSHSEGMPNVIMEGMARGLAVVSTDVGAVSLMVGSDNGILIKPKDVKALASALGEMTGLTADELLAKKQASLDKVRDRFLWDKVIGPIEQKIQALVS